ncbi:MAG: CDP-alcohol phosphatidyltransferase family protein [Xanthobacteraceae bacterium]
MHADGEPSATPSGSSDALAFSVHLFTASGAVLALLALLAATERNWATMFWLLGAALIIDGIDGTFARRLDVAKRLPRWSGDVLDLVVDFLTYVFIPAFAVVASGLLPLSLAVACAIAIILSGALYFADREMKTADYYFQGFPAVWNVPLFYLFLLQPPAWITAFAIFLLAACTFLPIPFVHPFRVKRGRVITIALLVVWCILASVTLLRDMMPGPWITAGLCAIALYFLGAGLLRRTDA